MRVGSKIRKIIKINVFAFFYFNFICKKVERRGKGYIIPYRHAVIELNKNSKIILHEGNLEVNYYCPEGSKAEAYIRLSEGAVLEILDSVCLCYHATIELKKYAKVIIGSAYINCGAVILAAENITIGREVLISREAYIYDSDHHPIIDEMGKQLNSPKPVVIEDHVWIGLKSLILRGSRIGVGAVIAANSLVGGKIKAGTMASGNPARSYSEIRWKKD